MQERPLSGFTDPRVIINSIAQKISKDNLRIIRCYPEFKKRYKLASTWLSNLVHSSLSTDLTEVSVDKTIYELFKARFHHTELSDNFNGIIINLLDPDIWDMGLILVVDFSTDKVTTSFDPNPESINEVLKVLTNKKSNANKYFISYNHHENS